MFPHKIINAGPDNNKRILSYFRGEGEGFVQVGDQKWTFPAEYERSAADIYQFSPRPDDVWIMTFPRSGTTLCQELIWLLKNNLDTKKSAEIDIHAKAPFLEFSILRGPRLIQETMKLNADNSAAIDLLKKIFRPEFETAAELANPRIIKTHLPFCLLSPTLLPTSKVIYIARNPKDVIISCYHHNKLFKLNHHEYCGDLKTYWQFFKDNLVCYSPYWEHLKQAWTHRYHPNMLFLFYENLSKDRFSEIKKIAKFLDVNYSDDQLQQLVNFMEINNFKQRVRIKSDSVEIKGIIADHTEEFIRNGKVNGGDPELTPELSKEIDEWTAAHLQNTDLRFPE